MTSPATASNAPVSLLHVGCGSRNLSGFINIDVAGDAADLTTDVRQGLPFPDNSVDGIFSEHFLEHLTLSEAVTFLRDCVRVLRPW